MGRNSDSDVMGTRVGWGASHAGEISATLAYFERAPQTINWGPRTLGEIWQKIQKASFFAALERQAMMTYSNFEKGQREASD